MPKNARRLIFLGLGELFLLALGLSMDAFAVSVCKGLAMKKATLGAGAVCGTWFGGFQGLMPLIGFFLGSLFAGIIQTFDYIVAFGLLAVIGANMLKEAFSNKCECEGCDADLSFKAMFVMAVATSIDALAVGISLAMKEANIWLAVGMIGGVTFLMCAAGVKIGSVFGNRFEKKAQVAGGVILILLAIKMLVEGILEQTGVL